MTDPDRELPRRAADWFPPALLAARVVIAPMTGFALPSGFAAARAWTLFSLIWLVTVAVPLIWDARRRRGLVSRSLPSWVGRMQLPLVCVLLFFGLPAILAAVICVVLVGLIVFGRERPGFDPSVFLWRWSPLLLTAFIYLNLASLLPGERSITADAWLAETDRSFLFIDVMPLIASLERAWLTEWFALHYAGYLLYPIIAGLALYLGSHLPSFDRHVSAFTVAMYLGFLLYLLVPATGPWIAFASSYAAPFPQGYFIGPMVESMVRNYAYHYDTFPSLHVANSAMSVAVLRKPYPRLFKLMLFCQLNLVIATVYLRMHYVTDLVVGAGLALVAWRAAEWAAGSVPERATIPAR